MSSAVGGGSLPALTARHAPLFGVSLVPSASGLAETLTAARAADATGLDLVGVQDHPYHPGFADTMTVLGAMLAATRRIHVFPDVASIPLRPPAMLAKAAATLDLLSNGRFELGVGSGGVWPAITAFGGPERNQRAAVDAFTEAIDVIRAVWSGRRAQRVDGAHYALRGAHGGPLPAHPIGLWIGSVGPRMLGITGTHGDGWAAPIPSYLPFEALHGAQDRIDDAAGSAGRDPRDVVRIHQLPGTITDHRDTGRLRGAEPLVGSVERWIETLVELAVELRFDAFVLWPDEPDEHQIRRFAEEVAPAVRERLAAARTPADLPGV